jgi:hypothetical protein
MKKCLNVLILMCMVNALWAKKGDESLIVEVIKKYPANDQSILDMDVSFANLSVNTAQVNEITVVMSASGLIEGDKCKEEVVDHFNQATKAISNGVSVRINGVFERCKTRQSCNVKVYVSITIPLKAAVSGFTNFTNVTMGSFTGPVKLNTDYGNISADGFWAYDNDVKVEFGNIEVKGTNGGKFEVDYGNVELIKLQGSAIVDVEFGNVELDEVLKQCTHLNVRVDYGNVDVVLDGAADYAFDIKSAYGNIDLDDRFKVSFSEKDYTEVLKKGTIGGGSGKLFVDVEFGNVELDVR